MSSKPRSLAGVPSKHIPGWARWLVFAVTFASTGLLSLGLRDRRTPRIHTSAPPRTFSVSEKAALGLNLARQGDDLVLSWNRDAPAIRAAVTSILVIQTGDNYEDFVLGPPELQTGKFTYRSAASQIKIGLHLYDGNDRRTNDSALFSVAPGSNGHDVPSPGNAPSRPKRVASGDQIGELPRSETVTADSDPSSGTAMELGEPPKVDFSRSETPARIELLSFARPGGFPVPNDQDAGTRAPAEAADSLPVVGEAPQVSPIRRVVTAIPLMKRLLHNSDFVPPTPSLSPVPEIPDRLRQELKREVAVNVKVFVNATGDVQYAELLTDGTGHDRELATLAVFESRRWKFHPALVKGKPRDSEVVLHYRFSRVAGPDVHP